MSERAHDDLQALVEQARLGEQSALDGLLQHCRTYAENHCRRRGISEGSGSVQDLAQEVCLEFLNSLRRFEYMSDPATKAYWRTIVEAQISSLKNMDRKHERIKNSISRLSVSQRIFTPDHLQNLCNQEVLRRCELFLRMQPPRTQIAFHMRYFLNRQFKEIAVACGYSTVGAASKDVSRCRDKLKKYLGHTG